MSQGKKIIQPPYLKEGDKVALIAPAYWVAQEALSMAGEVLKSWGLCPVVGVHTNSLNVDAYSGTADERAFDLLRMTTSRLSSVHVEDTDLSTY